MDFLYEHEQATRYTDSDSEFESTSETSPDPSTPRRPRNPPLADRGASTTVFRASPLWQSRSSTSGLDALVVAVGPDACDVLRRRLAEPLVPLAIAIPFTGAKATRPHGSAVKANPYFILAQADNPGTGYVLLADELDLLSLHSWGHTILKHMTPTRVFILQSLTVLQRESLIEGIMHRQYTDDGAEVEALRYLKSPGAPQLPDARELGAHDNLMVQGAGAALLTLCAATSVPAYLIVDPQSQHTTTPWVDLLATQLSGVRLTSSALASKRQRTQYSTGPPAAGPASSLYS